MVAFHSPPPRPSPASSHHQIAADVEVTLHNTTTGSRPTHPSMCCVRSVGREAALGLSTWKTRLCVSLWPPGPGYQESSSSSLLLSSASWPAWAARRGFAVSKRRFVLSALSCGNFLSCLLTWVHFSQEKRNEKARRVREHFLPRL